MAKCSRPTRVRQPSVPFVDTSKRMAIYLTLEILTAATLLHLHNQARKGERRAVAYSLNTCPSASKNLRCAETSVHEVDLTQQPLPELS